MKKNAIAIGFFAVCLVSSCKKESTPVDTANNGTFKVFTTGNITTVQNLSADTILGFAPSGQPFGAGRFTFFNLEQKALVPNSDSATNRWDVGFRGTTIIINGGSSGPAAGGGFVWNGAFENLTTIPADSVFRTDNASSTAIPSGSGRGWYNYNGPANLVTPLPGKVLVVRTATGKYAKLEMLNYYKGGQTPSSTASDDKKLREQRFYTFRYTFQPNGTKIF